MRRAARSAIAGLGALALAGAAHANPWPKDEGAAEIITTLTISRDAGSLSGTGVDAASEIHAEYGANARSTLVLDASMRQARAGAATAIVFDNAWAGGRAALFRDDDSVVSTEWVVGVAGVQAAPGVPDSVSLQGTAEARLMAGRGFTLWSHHAFAGVETGWHWRAGAPADEAIIDTVLGWEPWSGGLVLFQTFSLATVGSARGTYGPYNGHKLQFSVVQNFSETMGIQLGIRNTALGTDRGRSGLIFALWYRA